MSFMCVICDIKKDIMYGIKCACGDNHSICGGCIAEWANKEGINMDEISRSPKIKEICGHPGHSAHLPGKYGQYSRIELFNFIEKENTKYNTLVEQMDECRTEIKQLRAQVLFQPGGEGAKQAKRDFEERLIKLNKKEEPETD